MNEKVEKVKTTANNVYHEFKDHWSTPAEGKYVPYKEYVSILLAVGGNYSAAYLLGLLSFGTGCYLVAYYYEIPILTFTAINAFFLVGGYFWSILNMGVDANLGFFPKKTERKYNAVYLTFAVLGLALFIFDFSEIIPWPETIANYANTAWSGLNLYSILKILGIHWFVSGWGGFRGIFLRKKLIPKVGRYKVWAYANVIQCLVLVLLICELPLYEEELIDRVWKLYTLFALYGMVGYTGGAQSIADNISPNGHERMLIRSYPVKLSHLVRSIIKIILPTVAGMLFVNGIRDVGMFKYLLPPFLIFSTVMMMVGLTNIHERIPAPPVEKKAYFSFWTCIDGVLHNKYLWIRQISSLLDSLGNGMLDIKTLLLIYTWRETGFWYSLAENVIAFVGNPGAFLAPWIRKRFSYKQIIVFKYLVQFCSSIIYILAMLFLGDSPIACGIALFIGICCCDALKSAVELCSSDMDVRITDYQMYLSGERFESYQGVVSWFTSPISSLISLIIPLMFYRCGFTSDWDVLFISDVRVKCAVIGIAFDMVGYLLMTIPYLLFWDYSDDMHKKIMYVLRLRADAIDRGEDPMAIVITDDMVVDSATGEVVIRSEVQNE